MDSLDFVGVVRNRATAKKERKCKDVSGTLYDYYTIILLTLFVMPACSV